MNQFKEYIYKTIILLLIILIAIILIRWGCYKKPQSVITKIEQIESELKQNPELATIVISKKPKGIAVITKATGDKSDKSDTTIKTKEFDIPIESDYKIKIDTTGQVNVIYSKWGTCFFPKISMDFLPSGYTFGLSARLLYVRRWGLEAGICLYPIVGVKGGLDYRIPKFSNCTIQGGLFHNGKSLMGYCGIGIFLW